MTDRELLELAAKAAGIEPSCWNAPIYAHEGGPKLREGGMWDYVSGNPLWNPLTDDGDALRLAVGLGLLDGGSDYLMFRTQEILNGHDPFAATRRAIVRAAAEVWRKA